MLATAITESVTESQPLSLYEHLKSLEEKRGERRRVKYMYKAGSEGKRKDGVYRREQVAREGG